MKFIIVYSLHKTGSTTLYKAAQLASPQATVIHTHEDRFGFVFSSPGQAPFRARLDLMGATYSCWQRLIGSSIEWFYSLENASFLDLALPDDTIDVIGSFRDPLTRSISMFLHGLNVTNLVDADVQSERTEAYLRQAVETLKSVPPTRQTHIAVSPNHPLLWHIYASKRLPALRHIQEVFCNEGLRPCDEYEKWLNNVKQKLNLDDIPLDRIDSDGLLAVDTQLSNGCNVKLHLIKLENLNDQVIQQVFGVDRRIKTETWRENTSQDARYLFTEDVRQVRDALKAKARNHPRVESMYRCPIVRQLGYTRP